MKVCEIHDKPPVGYGPCVLPEGHSGPCCDETDFEDGDIPEEYREFAKEEVERRRK